MKLDLTADEFRMIKVALANSHLILKDVHGTTKKQEEMIEKERKAMFKLFQKLDKHE